MRLNTPATFPQRHFRHLKKEGQPYARASPLFQHSSLTSPARLFSEENIPESTAHQFLELFRRWVFHEHHVGRNLLGVFDRRIDTGSHYKLAVFGDLLLSFGRAGEINV